MGCWGESPRKVAVIALAGWLIAATIAAAIVWNGGWTAPPRFDGAGYAVLARAIASGQSYRAIDHPDRPLHAHFPPGYPLVLALTWRIAQDSLVVAHGVSWICTVGATMASWWWFRRLMSGPAAFALGTALAVNWLWIRTGNAILSEPLYLLLSQSAILAEARLCDRATKPIRDLITLGLLLAACVLTRHVALGLVLAVLVDLAWRRRWRETLVTTVLITVLVAPWLTWMATAAKGGGTQASLVAQGSALSFHQFGQQALFYIRRIPDQITGPIVEVATRFQGSRWIAAVATLWAACSTAVIFAGWLLILRRRRRRLAGLIPIATLGMLLFWPFTEAGRFLIPLVPFILFGGTEGLAALLGTLARWARWPTRESRWRLVAACAMLTASLPYTVFMLATGRAGALEVTHRDFDAACDWLAGQADRPGIVLSRHPGEVYLRTGRQGLEVSSVERPGDEDANPSAIDETVRTRHAAYLLIDKQRYAGASASPLETYVARYPDRVRLVWGRLGDSVSIFEVRPEK